MAYHLRMPLSSFMELSHEEILGWVEFFERRPPEWRADNRAAIIAMSFGGGKTKPEDLFASLKVIKEEQTNLDNQSIAGKLYNKLGGEFL